MEKRSVFLHFNFFKVNIMDKTAFDPIKLLYEKGDGHSKRERVKIIDLHLKRVSVG